MVFRRPRRVGVTPLAGRSATAMATAPTATLAAASVDMVELEEDIRYLLAMPAKVPRSCVTRNERAVKGTEARGTVPRR